MKIFKFTTLALVFLAPFLLWGARTFASGSYTYISGPDGGVQQNGWYEYKEQLPSITIRADAASSCGGGTFTLSLAPDGSDNMGSHVLRYFYVPSDSKDDLWVSRDGNLLGSVCNDDSSYSGNTVTVWQGTVKYDGWPPVINISSPAANTNTTSSSIVVSGSAYDTGDDSKAECLSLSRCSLLASVMVNGVAATIVGDKYTAKVPLEEGLNKITATAIDNAGTASTSPAITVLRSNVAVSGDQSSKGSTNFLFGVGVVVLAGAVLAGVKGYIPYVGNK